MNLVDRFVFADVTVTISLPILTGKSDELSDVMMMGYID